MSNGSRDRWAKAKEADRKTDRSRAYDARPRRAVNMPLVGLGRYLYMYIYVGQLDATVGST